MERLIKQTHAPVQSVVFRASSQMLRFTLVMILTGGVLAGWATLNVCRQYQCTSWQSVTGKLISQQYRQLPYSRKRRQHEAQLDLSYEYSVDGQTYRAARYSIWRSVYQDSDDAVHDFMDAHTNGAPVTVYFDPKAPAEAVLWTAPDWNGNFALAVLGFFFAFIGFFMRNISLPSHPR